MVKPPPPASIEIVCDGRTHVVNRASLVAGRGESCEFHVVHPLVSREHCRIEARAEGVFVFDLGSHNGTWVNGARIDAVRRVRTGDRIRLGSDGAELVLGRAVFGGRDVGDLATELNAATMDVGDPRAAGIRARVSVRDDDASTEAAHAAATSGHAKSDAPKRRGDAVPSHTSSAVPSLAPPPAPLPAPPLELPPPPPPGPGLVRRTVLFAAGALTGVALVAAIAVFTDFPERLGRVLPHIGLRGDGTR